MSNELLSPKQTADLLGIHLNTVYRLIHNGDLTAKRLGPKLLRISATEIEKYTKGQN